VQSFRFVRSSDRERLRRTGRRLRSDAPYPLGLCAWCVLGDLRSLQTQSTHQTFLTEEEDVNAFLKRSEAAKKGGVFRGNRAVSAATLFGR
jgi:hypothetical protein